MDKVTLKAPAKLNLFLKVLAKRPDGYHQIETLFEKIALFDNIKIEKASRGIMIQTDAKNLPTGKENLAYQAAALMEDRFKKSLGVKIDIEKSIPIGAGLGGGSSDAAAVLIGINRLYDLNLSTGELELLAKELGADVPFFVSNKIWAVGGERGDRIEGLEADMKLWHILIVPPFSILTKDAYEWVDEQSKKTAPDINETILTLKKNDVKLLGKKLHNDLEGIAFEKMDSLKELRDKLIEYGAKGAMITGSGPALFGIVEKHEEVIKLSERIQKGLATESGWQVLAIPTFYNE